MSNLNLNTQAKSVVSALVAFDKASAKTSDTIGLAFQQMVDAAVVAGIAKDEPGVKAFMAQIRMADPFIEAVSIGLIEQKTVTEYAQSAGRAFFHNVPFAQGLKNDEAYKLPWGKAGKGTKAPKAGKTTTTDRDALDATARKLLEQARLLGLNELAASLLDVLIDGLDGFTETPAKK